MNIVVVGTQKAYFDIYVFLHPDCRIIGYSDFDFFLRDRNSFSGLPYGKICDFDNVDCFLIAYTEQWAIDQCLLEIKNKAIVFKYFKEMTFADPVQLFIESEIDFEQVILGMSHSENDIDADALSKRTFKFSFPSMDLHCHFSILKMLFNYAPKKIKKCSYVLLELPYYIFNYDLSLSRRSAWKRIPYFDSYGDYHNYDNGEMKKQYELIKNVFFLPNAKYALNSIKIKKRGILSWLSSMKKALTETNSIWSKIHNNTIEENINIWDKIINLLKEINPNVKIIVLVCPFNPIFRIKNKRFIKTMRELFYKTIKHNDLLIIDKFDYYKNPFRFVDHCHLSGASAFEFTKTINQVLNDKQQ